MEMTNKAIKGCIFSLVVRTMIRITANNKYSNSIILFGYAPVDLILQINLQKSHRHSLGLKLRNESLATVLGMDNYKSLLILMVEIRQFIHQKGNYGILTLAGAK